jgi:hypothetical protein
MTTTIERAEASLSTGKPVFHPTDSHVSQMDFFLSDYLTSLSRPTTPSMTGRQSPTNGYASTLSLSSWLVVTMISKSYIFLWHLRPCHSPGSTSYDLTLLYLGTTWLQVLWKFLWCAHPSKYSDRAQNMQTEARWGLLGILPLLCRVMCPSLWYHN